MGIVQYASLLSYSSVDSLTFDFLESLQLKVFFTIIFLIEVRRISIIFDISLGVARVPGLSFWLHISSLTALMLFAVLLLLGLPDPSRLLTSPVS